MPRVSIIVPVYNAAKAIRRCIESILKQDYEDFELILVDDGSKDESPQILDEYAEKDKRVVVVHQPNGGVSAARNKALSLAKGEFLQFLDADDWMTVEATKLLVRTMDANQADMVVADFYRVVGDTVARKGSISTDKVLTRQEYAEFMMESPADYYYGVLWNKLYRRSIIDMFEVHMDEDLKWCEDFVFNLEYVLHCDRIVALQVPVYYYVKTEGSLVAKNLNLSRIVQMKTSMFTYYNNFYRNVLDPETYNSERINIARFLVEAAKDDAAIPLMPGSHKLGEEEVKVHFRTGESDSVPMNYYIGKLYEHYLHSIAMKYDLSLNEVRILSCIRDGSAIRSQKDIADYAGMSQLTATSTMGMMVLKSLIAFDDKDNEVLISVSDKTRPVLRDIELARKDLTEVMLKGFTEEERKTAQDFIRRISENVKNRMVRDESV